MDKWMEKAATGARAIAERLNGHSMDEKRLIAAAYMCGFMDSHFENEAARKTEQSGENGRS